MIIHLTGVDTYRSRARLHQLRDVFVAKHDVNGLNTVVLDGLTATKDELRAALTSGGLFAAKTFVALNGYESSGAVCSPADVSEALALVTDTKDVIAVVREVTKPVSEKKTFRGKKIAQLEAPLKVPGAKLEVFSLQSVTESKIWAGREAKRLGGEISPAVAELLVAATDNDPWRLAMELEKLLTHAGNQPISEEDVRQLVISPVSSDIFALTDAIGGRQRRQALKLLQRELAAGVHPLGLITMIARHFRTLSLVRQAVADGLPRAQMATKFGFHPFVVGKALEQSKKFTAEDLRRWHHQLLKTDFYLKSTPLDAESMLDLIVIGA